MTENSSKKAKTKTEKTAKTTKEENKEKKATDTTATATTATATTTTTTEGGGDATTATTTTTTTNNEPIKPFHINILKMIRKSRDAHGVRTKDYGVYRKYCTNHVSDLRGKMKLRCKDPDNKHQPKAKTTKKNKKKTTEEKTPSDEPVEEKRWNPKYKKKHPATKVNYTYVKIDNPEMLTVANHGEELLIPLFLSERCWVYSQQLYEQFDEDRKRKYHHSNNKLRKAIVWAKNVYRLTRTCDDETKLQAYVYLKLMQGNYDLQTQKFETALNSLLQGVIILEQLQAIEEDEDNKEAYSYLIQSVKEKLTFLEQSVARNDTAALEKIRQNARSVIEKALSEPYQKLTEAQGKKKKTTSEINTEEKSANVDESEAKDQVIFRGKRIQIQKYPQIIQNIVKYRHQLKKLSKLSIEKAGRDGYGKRYRLYFKMTKSLEYCLKWATQEVNKSTSGGSSDITKSLQLAQQYFMFQLARITLTRLQDWQMDKIYYLKLNNQNEKSTKNDGGKSKSEKKNEEKEDQTTKKKKGMSLKQKKKIYYDLATLCEEQIKQVDTLHEAGNADTNIEFQKELDMIRQSYEIQRKYYIGRIYYGNNEYLNSNVVFEGLQSDCQQFLKEFEGKEDNQNKKSRSDNNEKWDEFIGLSPFIPLTQHIKWIASLVNDCKKFAIFSKAKVVLDMPNKGSAKESLQQWEAKDMGLTVYPLLPKPVVYDLAWTCIEYGVTKENAEMSEEKSDDSLRNKNSKHGRQHKHDDEENTTGVQEQSQETRKKWFGIF